MSEQILTKLAVMEDGIKEIKMTLAEIKDDFKEHTKSDALEFGKIHMAEASMQGTMKGGKIGSAFALVVLLPLAVYAYNADRKEIKKEVKDVATKAQTISDRAETVATDLKTYQNSQQTNWEMVITRLEAGLSAEKLRALKQQEEDENRPAVAEPTAELDQKIPLVQGINKDGSPDNE